MAADKRTAEYQLMSPFIRLPAELRNRMYEFTFHDTTVKVYERKKHHKQLHMLGPFYAASTFDFTNVRQGLHADTVWWLDSITFFRLCSIDPLVVKLEQYLEQLNLGWLSGIFPGLSHVCMSNSFPLDWQISVLEDLTEFVKGVFRSGTMTVTSHTVRSI
ncbi:hypothetical protein HBH47_123110 [Parastagonospora nodorum]|nr:hypothetical protein HBH47_123110 [Parastagonospora nodorum]